MSNDTVQRVAAVARQILALASVVVGSLTASVSSIHLPPAVSAVLVAVGGVILSVEHFVGTTGSSSTPLTSVVGKVESEVTTVEGALKTLLDSGHAVSVSPAGSSPSTVSVASSTPTPPAGATPA